jgi:3-oxoacyl-[acyl-carrier protein] reductase
MMEEYAHRHIARGVGWGRIINITTVSYGFAGEISYGASKHAMESYSRAAAFELGPYGITVNIICPGAVQTGWITAKLEEEIRARYPLRRIGRPQDIANAVIFFASDKAEWITGQMIYVGGGHQM